MNSEYSTSTFFSYNIKKISLHEPFNAEHGDNLFDISFRNSAFVAGNNVMDDRQLFKK